jgi:hypothetical protein
MRAAPAGPNALCTLILPFSNGISTIPVEIILSELQQFLAFHFSRSIRFFIHTPDHSLKDVSRQNTYLKIFMAIDDNNDRHYLGSSGNHSAKCKLYLAATQAMRSNVSVTQRDFSNSDV